MNEKVLVCNHQIERPPCAIFLSFSFSFSIAISFSFSILIICTSACCSLCFEWGPILLCECSTINLNKCQMFWNCAWYSNGRFPKARILSIIWKSIKQTHVYTIFRLFDDCLDRYLFGLYYSEFMTLRKYIYRPRSQRNHIQFDLF